MRESILEVLGKCHVEIFDSSVSISFLCIHVCMNICMYNALPNEHPYKNVSL